MAEAKGPYGTRGYEQQQQPVRWCGRTGWLFKRADVCHSSWYFRLFVSEEGRHFRKALDTTDPDEARRRAEQMMNDLLTRVQRGEKVMSTPTVGDIAREFCQFLEAQGAAGRRSRNTVKNQRYRVNLGCQFMKEKLDAGLQTKASAFNPRLLDDYLDWRVAKLQSATPPKTIRDDVVRDEVIIIKKMFKWAHEKGLCPATVIPTTKIEVGSEAMRCRMTTQNYRDYVRILRKWARSATGERQLYNRAMVQHVALVMANIGMRTGEVLNLRNRDLEIHERAGEVVIDIKAEYSKVRAARRVTLCSSMGGREDEGAVAINYLIRWVKNLQRHAKPSDYVFAPFGTGDKSATTVVYHAYGSLRSELRKIDIDWFDLYHCRHYWITTMLLAGWPINIVAKTAGTSTHQIEKTYSHVLTEIATRQFGSRRLIYREDGSFKTVEVGHEAGRHAAVEMAQEVATT